MSLTGLPLRILMIVLALAAVSLTVRLAPRLSRAWVRALAMLGCQLFVLLALLTAGNAYFDFYQSWGDLTGIASASSGPSGSGPVTRVADSFMDQHQVPIAEGRLESVIIRGSRSGISTPAYIYLPPQYRTEPNRRFPVAIALTGYPGDAQNLITQIQLPLLASQETAAGRMQPMIFVMLRPMVTPPRDTECTDVPGGPQAATFFGQDVPAAIGSAYRTTTGPTGWGILGDSTGGYCATKITMMYSDRYSAAVSLSGYYHALSDFTTGDLWGGSASFRRENDLIWRLRNQPPPPISVMATSSLSGEGDYNETMLFVRLARPPMRVSTLILPAGGHHFSVWRRELPATLDWLGSRLG
ncbi:MAG: esterase [Actinomycetia bacterium]|nr:esterase [Actinomycetes bacterium]